MKDNSSVEKPPRIDVVFQHFQEQSPRFRSFFGSFSATRVRIHTLYDFMDFVP